MSQYNHILFFVCLIFTSQRVLYFCQVLIYSPFHTRSLDTFFFDLSAKQTIWSCLRPSVMQLMSANYYQVVIKYHIKWIWIASSLNHKLHTYRRGLFWGTLQSNSILNPPQYYWFLLPNSFVLRNKTKQVKTYVCHMSLGMIAVTFVNEWSMGLYQHYG